MHEIVGNGDPRDMIAPRSASAGLGRNSAYSSSQSPPRPPRGRGGRFRNAPAENRGCRPQSNGMRASKDAGAAYTSPCAYDHIPLWSAACVCTASCFLFLNTCSLPSDAAPRQWARRELECEPRSDARNTLERQWRKVSCSTATPRWQAVSRRRLLGMVEEFAPRQPDLSCRSPRIDDAHPRPSHRSASARHPRTACHRLIDPKRDWWEPSTGTHRPGGASNLLVADPNRYGCVSHREDAGCRPIHGPGEPHRFIRWMSMSSGPARAGSPRDRQRPEEAGT